MICSDYKQLLDLFLDEEIEGEEALAVEEHLGTCTECFNYVKNAMSLRAKLKAEDAALGQPAELAIRVQNILDAEDRRSWAVRLAKLAPIVVAAGVAVALFFWTRSGGNFAFVEPVLAAHAQNLPMDVQAQDPEKVSGWFRGRVPFAVRPPIFHRPEMRMVGARLASLNRNLAAYIAYKRGARKYSLFVFEPAMNNFKNIAGARVNMVNNRPVYILHRHGYSLAIWRDRQLAYFLASDTGTDDLLSLAYNALAK
ncbi:MAG: hypothetical protein GXP49_16635 [Deltaproteobacteria bacterium]|nr:hypothetical protein [Deltaproteobacteria bacterium]